MRAFSSTAARSIRTTAVRGFRTTAVTQERCADQTMAFGPSLGDLGTALMRFGPRLFVRKMMMFNGEMKLGSLIGVDEFGNEYFENTAYPYPRHRWVEYAGLPWTQNCDASDIGAEWHGWLHNMTDQIPATHSPAEGGKIFVHSDAPYDHNVGLHSGNHTPNMTSNKRRGYGVGGFRSTPEEREQYWTQPGHPLNERDDVDEVAEFESWSPDGPGGDGPRRLRSLDLE